MDHVVAKKLERDLRMRDGDYRRTEASTPPQTAPQYIPGQAQTAFRETPQLKAKNFLNNVLDPRAENREQVLDGTSIAPWEVRNAHLIHFSPHTDTPVPKPQPLPQRGTLEEAEWKMQRKLASEETIWRQRTGANAPSVLARQCYHPYTPKPRSKKTVTFGESTRHTTIPRKNRFFAEMWCDASVIHGKASAGAALTYTPTSLRVTRKITRGCGWNTVSYRGEALTIEEALTEILRPLTDPIDGMHRTHPKRYRGRHYLIATDSQSIIMALMKGPLAQTEPTEDRLWKLLLRIADLGAEVTFQFVYSHCGVPLNELADKEAGIAVEAVTVDETPVWLQDVSRCVKQHIRAERQKNITTDTHREGLVGRIPQQLSRALPRCVAVRFVRLRTGESLEIGILRRRLCIDLSLACRWCCPHAHPVKAPPAPEEAPTRGRLKQYSQQSYKGNPPSRSAPPKRKGESKGPTLPPGRGAPCTHVITHGKKAGQICGRIRCQFHYTQPAPVPPATPTSLVPIPLQIVRPVIRTLKVPTLEEMEMYTEDPVGPTAAELLSIARARARSAGVTAPIPRPAPQPAPPPLPRAEARVPPPDTSTGSAVSYVKFSRRLRSDPDVLNTLPICPHCSQPRPLAHRHMCPMRPAQQQQHVLPAHLTTIDGPDETLDHLVHHCQCEGIVKLREEILIPHNVPLSEMLLENDMTLLTFMDKALKLLEQDVECKKSTENTTVEEPSQQQGT